MAHPIEADQPESWARPAVCVLCCWDFVSLRRARRLGRPRACTDDHQPAVRDLTKSIAAVLTLLCDFPSARIVGEP